MTALFKGAWEENEGPNWGGKVGRLPASKTVSSSAEGECHLHHECMALWRVHVTVCFVVSCDNCSIIYCVIIIIIFCINDLHA